MSEIINVITAQAPVEQEATRARRWNAMLLVGICIIGLLIVGSIVVPLVSAYGSETANPLAALQAPSSHHIFGTDADGMDVFTRVFYAPRLDLSIAAGGTVIGLVAGVTVGLVAGLSRGLVGEVMMRLTDLLQAFPVLIVALSIVALAGNNTADVIWAIGILSAPVFVRLTRSRVLTVRELRYIEAARSIGNPEWKILVRHVLPNSISPVIVQFGISMGYSILILAGLSFLGVGVQAPTPEWGAMILEGRNDITTGDWWTSVFPGVALIVAVFGFNLIAEGIERSRELT